MMKRFEMSDVGIMHIPWHQNKSRERIFMSQNNAIGLLKKFNMNGCKSVRNENFKSKTDVKQQTILPTKFLFKVFGTKPL